MASRTATLCAILLVFLAFHAAWTILRREQPVKETWLYPAVDADAETLLAFGARIPLACADIADLELIPGISDRLALELLENRARIIAHAESTSEREALQLAHGVADRTADKLASFISLEDSCHQGDTYRPPPPYEPAPPARSSTPRGRPGLKP
jgi:hypothetical protein